MLKTFQYTVRSTPKVLIPKNTQVRSFWEYVNQMFNTPDADRLKQFGPDRTCAEWVLRNGGRVVWDDGTSLSDYNSLPPDGAPVKKLKEIDGTNSSISHYGFAHLIGCSMLNKIILHKNNYIDDRALKGLHYAKSTLQHLQVSKCINVTDMGIKELKALSNLKTAILFNLQSVSDLPGCILYLQQHLPNCKILDKDIGFMENK